MRVSDDLSIEIDEGVSPASYSPIIFPEILTRLIDESPYRNKRRTIWESVGISSAALSQYTLGKARPRFEILVALADFFGVTVDYLLTGRQPNTQSGEESRSIMRYVDWTLVNLQSKIGGRASMTARVGELLARQIGAAVEEVTNVPPGGMLTSDESLVLESHSLETHVLTVLMEQNVLELENGEPALNRFGLTVAANIMATPPRPYRFLLFEQPGRPLLQATHTLRRLFREELKISEDRLRFCQFRKTSQKVLIGACFYRMDMTDLSKNEPSLALAVEDYVGPDGWVGYAINDVETPQVLITPDRLPSSLATFDNMWQSAEPC